MAGVCLIVGALVAVYVTDYLIRRSVTVGFGLFAGYEVAGRIMAPTGATLIAASLVARALARPFSSPSPRAHLLAGLALLGVGLLRITLGTVVLTFGTGLLGATSTAGMLVLEFLARVVSLVALPLAVALLATHPLVMLAHTWQAGALSGGPPDLESLD